VAAVFVRVAALMAPAGGTLGGENGRIAFSTKL
jgi:hypothetical protein